MIRNIDDALKLNIDSLRDRINACWLGKNIGGTIGAPIEGCRRAESVTGFTSQSLLPNDDLDLQLVWLRAVDEMGIDSITAAVLGEYWLSYVSPSWEEYGVCKRNLREGMLPPMSGAFQNEWSHSNGAWIRSEIWACLSPGKPEQAARLAFEDSCVDHGMGEGTYAAIFTAAMEAAAFVISDISLLIKIGLSKIPSDCRVARSISIAVDGYQNGVSWEETRQRIVDDSEDLGWFQAPANVAYVIIGLLYGEGDFKKTVLYAVNCGDDTDCSGATAGAILGIANGTAIIPPDWRQFIGDEIKTVAVTTGHGNWPATCTELTDGIMRILPSTVRNRVTSMLPGLMPVPETKSDQPVILTHEKNDISTLRTDRFMGSTYFSGIAKIVEGSRYFLKTGCPYADLWVVLDREPYLTAEETITGRVFIAVRRMSEQKNFHLSWHIPVGWKVGGQHNIISTTTNPMTLWDTPDKNSTDELFDNPYCKGEFTITAGECPGSINRIVLEVTATGRCMPMYVPIIILG